MGPRDFIQVKYEMLRRVSAKDKTASEAAQTWLLASYLTPQGELIEFPRAESKLPKEPIEIKPHPKGIELGTLIQLLQRTREKHLRGFLRNDFCRIGLSPSLLYPSLRMGPEERRERHRRLSAVVDRTTAVTWARDFLAALEASRTGRSTGAGRAPPVTSPSGTPGG